MRRKPRTIVWCACGCKTALETPDSEGRERKFVSGHNGRKYHGKEAEAWGRNKRWAKKHPEVVRERKKRYHRQRKIKCIKYLGEQCKHCLERYNGKNGAIFQFHHRNPKTKKFVLGNQVANYTWKTLVKELRKCDLVCANCHFLHHGGEW